MVDIYSRFCMPFIDSTTALLEYILQMKLHAGKRHECNLSIAVEEDQSLQARKKPCSEAERKYVGTRKQNYN